MKIVFNADLVSIKDINKATQIIANCLKESYPQSLEAAVCIYHIENFPTLLKEFINKKSGKTFEVLIKQTITEIEKYLKTLKPE